MGVFKNKDAVPGQVRELLGATCIDLNIIVPISTLRTMDCWGDFWTQVTNETTTCTPYSLTESELEDLRAAITPEAVCQTTTPASEYCPPTRTSSNTPECNPVNTPPVKANSGTRVAGHVMVAMVLLALVDVADVF